MLLHTSLNYERSLTAHVVLNSCKLKCSLLNLSKLLDKYLHAFSGRVLENRVFEKKIIHKVWIICITKIMNGNITRLIVQGGH